MDMFDKAMLDRIKQHGVEQLLLTVEGPLTSMWSFQYRDWTGVITFNRHGHTVTLNRNEPICYDKDVSGTVCEVFINGGYDHAVESLQVVDLIESVTDEIANGEPLQRVFFANAYLSDITGDWAISTQSSTEARMNLRFTNHVR